MYVYIYTWLIALLRSSLSPKPPGFRPSAGAISLLAVSLTSALFLLNVYMCTCVCVYIYVYIDPVPAPSPCLQCPWRRHFSYFILTIIYYHHSLSLCIIYYKAGATSLFEVSLTSALFLFYFIYQFIIFIIIITINLLYTLDSGGERQGGASKVWEEEGVRRVGIYRVYVCVWAGGGGVGRGRTRDALVPLPARQHTHTHHRHACWRDPHPKKRQDTTIFLWVAAIAIYVMFTRTDRQTHMHTYMHRSPSIVRLFAAHGRLRETT
jgi:hypothetical protein